MLFPFAPAPVDLLHIRGHLVTTAGFAAHRFHSTVSLGKRAGTGCPDSSPPPVLRIERFRSGRRGLAPTNSHLRCRPERFGLSYLRAAVRRRRADRLPPRDGMCVPPSLRVSRQTGQMVICAQCSTAKKTGREGQQRRLRDESGPARTALARVLADLGTHVFQELPGLTKVSNDTGIGFRGGSGH